MSSWDKAPASDFEYFHLISRSKALPLGLKQQLFLVSPFKPVNKLDRGPHGPSSIRD